MPNVFTTGDELEFLRGAGLLYLGATPLGVSDGDFTFDPAPEWENTPIADKTYKLKGLDERLGGDPVISGTLIQWADPLTAVLEPGSGTAGTPIEVTTPQAAMTYLAPVAYLTDLRLLFPKVGATGYKEITFPIALCVTYTIRGRSRGKSIIDVRFEARADPAAPDVCPYVIKDRPTIN